MAGIQKGWADLDFSSIARHYGYPHEDNVLPDTVFASAKAKSGENGMGASEKRRRRDFSSLDVGREPCAHREKTVPSGDRAFACAPSPGGFFVLGDRTRVRVTGGDRLATSTGSLEQ